MRLCVLGCFAPDAFNVWGFVYDAQLAKKSDMTEASHRPSRRSERAGAEVISQSYTSKGI